MNKRLLTMAGSGLLVLGVAIGGARATAQEPSGGGGEHMGQQHRMMSPDEELKRLDSRLKLTDDQKSQIKPILEDRQKKMADLHSDTSVSPEDRRTKMRSIMEDSNGKIRDVLNDDQKKQFDDMQQHMHGRTRGPGGGAPPAPPQP